MLLAVTNTECNADPGPLARVGRAHVAAPDSAPSPTRSAPSDWNGVEPTLENLASGRYPLGEVDVTW